MKRIKSLLFFVLFTNLFSYTVKAENKEPMFIVHFETGPAWQADVAPNQQTGFDLHAKNLQELRKAGVIKFGARYQDYGLIFLSAESEETASAILNADPGVKSGLFVYRIAPMRVFYPFKAEGD